MDIHFEKISYEELGSVSKGRFGAVYPGIDGTIVKIIKNKENFIELVSDTALEYELTFKAHEILPNSIPEVLRIWFEKDQALLQESRVDFPITTEDLTPKLYEQIHDILDTLHSHGIIHGDMHLRNIMKNKDGSPVIIDFGVGCLDNLDIGKLFDHLKFAFNFLNSFPVADPPKGWESMFERLFPYFDLTKDPELLENLDTVKRYVTKKDFEYAQFWLKNSCKRTVSIFVDCVRPLFLLKFKYDETGFLKYRKYLPTNKLPLSDEIIFDSEWIIKIKNSIPPEYFSFLEDVHKKLAVLREKLLPEDTKMISEEETQINFQILGLKASPRIERLFNDELFAAVNEKLVPRTDLLGRRLLFPMTQLFYYQFITRKLITDKGFYPVIIGAAYWIAREKLQIKPLNWELPSGISEICCPGRASQLEPVKQLIEKTLSL